MAVVPQI